MNTVQRAIKISVVYLKLISPTSGTYSEKLKTESTGIDLIRYTNVCKCMLIIFFIKQIQN